MKKKHGRPSKYNGEETDKRAFKFALLGMTDEQMAAAFDVNVDTIHEWKKRHPSFSDSLNSGKYDADGEVVVSLWKRATGYREKEVKVFCHEGVIISKEFDKVYPPDPASMIFWLKNRQRLKWTDREREELILASQQIKIEISKDDSEL